MVSKADIVVQISMTLEQAIGVRELLGTCDTDHPTHPVWVAVTDAMIKAKNVLVDL